MARWWVRPIAFIALTLAFYMAYILIYYDHPAYIVAGGTRDNIFLFISLMLASGIIESLRAESRFWAFGIRIDCWMGRDLGFAISLNFIIYIFFIIAFLIAGAEFGHDTRYGMDSREHLWYFLSGVIFLLFGAANEELMFRGIIFQSIMQRFSPGAAAFVTAAAFSALHMGNPDIGAIAYINIFLAGLLLSVMYIQTLSLWLPIFFHFFWNIFQPVFLGMPISGVYYGRVEWNVMNDANNPAMRLIFGGGFGIEGGLMCTFVLIALIYISARYAKQSPYMAARTFRRNIAESRLMYRS